MIIPNTVSRLERMRLLAFLSSWNANTLVNCDDDRYGLCWGFREWQRAVGGPASDSPLLEIFYANGLDVAYPFVSGDHYRELRANRAQRDCPVRRKWVRNAIRALKKDLA